MGLGMASPSSQPIRLSVRWLFVAALLMFGLGIVGGIVGQHLVGPAISIPTEKEDRLISTIQQVTVSPNKNRAQVLEAAKRSVVLLRQTQGNSSSFVGTGLVVTNDGLIATTAALGKGEISVVDEQGKNTVVAVVGTDPLYGITYLKLPSGVAVPIELSLATDVVGTDVVGVTRNPITLLIQTYLSHSATYQLPRERDSALGYQRLLKSSTSEDEVLSGAALLDEEGKLAGLVIDPEAGVSVTATDIKASLDRIVAGKREVNPFEAVGMGVTYRFVDIPTVTALPGDSEENTHTFVAVVTAVRPRSAAAEAGLKVGDMVTAVADIPLSWHMSLAQQLEKPLPLTLTALRQGSERTVTLQSVPSL
jgi:S1-C subfamily serine protease